MKRSFADVAEGLRSLRAERQHWERAGGFGPATSKGGNLPGGPASLDSRLSAYHALVVGALIGQQLAHGSACRVVASRSCNSPNFWLADAEVFSWIVPLSLATGRGPTGEAAPSNLCLVQSSRLRVRRLKVHGSSRLDRPTRDTVIARGEFQGDTMCARSVVCRGGRWADTAAGRPPAQRKGRGLGPATPSPGPIPGGLWRDLRPKPALRSTGGGRCQVAGIRLPRLSQACPNSNKR